MRFTIDIDTGGTFTDGFFTDQAENRVEIVKVSTSPHDLTVCFLECVKGGAERFGLPLEEMLRQTGVIRFSSTIATNAIIQHHGPKLGLIVTAGQEFTLYETGGAEPAVIREGFVQPDMVVGVSEYVNPGGQVLRSPDPAAVLAGLQSLIDRGARGIVICLGNGGINHANEQAIKKTIKAEYPSYYLGSIPAFTASETTERPGDALRLNTAVLNAYVHEHLARYLYKAEEKIRQAGYTRPLLVVHSNGGAARVAKTQAIHTYNSGPVAGILGARSLAETYNLPYAISMDIGGTSVDIGVITRGRVDYDLTPRIAELPVNVPMIRVSALGGAGGSIAWINAQGRLEVGPQSAGALPGPACFDLGGVEATVTDADVMLGGVDPDYFLGGKMRLNRDKARAAVQTVADRLGCSVEAAAWRIRQTVDQATALNIRRVAEANGWGEAEISDATLIAYGGAGPTHAANILAELGAKRAVTMPQSPVFSAFSSSMLDVLHTYSAASRLVLTENDQIPATPDQFNAVVQPLMARARSDMQGEGFAADAMRHGLELLVQTGAGEVAVTTPKGRMDSPDDLRQLAETCRRAAGLDGHQPVVVTMVTLRATAGVPHHAPVEQPLADANPSAAQKGQREVYWQREQGWMPTKVYEGGRLLPGNCVNGPAVIEAEDTTCLIPPGFRFTLDRRLNGFLEWGSGGREGEEKARRPAKAARPRAGTVSRANVPRAAAGSGLSVSGPGNAAIASDGGAGPVLEGRPSSGRALIRREMALQLARIDVASFVSVSKVFVTPSGMVTALENVSLTVRQGEFVCLVGASGCGKTTALRMMAALDYPSAGLVCLDGTPMRAPSHKIGFVFQQPNLLPWRTILQNVILPLTVRKTVTQTEAEARGMKMLELVGLADFAGHYPRELSGGMQQRAGIVRALINDPELLLMDEPFGALDTITREELNLELLRIWERSGKTVMFVTHSIAEAVFLADRVYVMTPRPGRIAAEVDVPFGRPRTLDLLHDVEFQDVVAEVRQAI